jgi:hypothetical protein
MGMQAEQLTHCILYRQLPFRLYPAVKKSSIARSLRGAKVAWWNLATQGNPYGHLMSIDTKRCSTREISDENSARHFSSYVNVTSLIALCTMTVKPLDRSAHSIYTKP